ncbi:MAG TPA: Ig-like domain-containing protein [Thermoanaerobaculia bacterium]|nr:Ig-like domain-containing protein [Thermoanaerobaculia bacterium]
MLTFNSAPNFEAPADAGANNVYDVQVTVTDSGAQTGVQNLQVTVTNVNEPPTAIADTADITEEAPNVAAANTVSGNVLTNDTDPDVPPNLTVSAVNGSAALVGNPVAGTYGSVTINSNGSFTYTLDDTNPTVNALAPGGMLTETFNYTASDGSFTSSSMLTVTIHGADDPATPDDDAFDFIGNTQLEVDRDTASTPEVIENTGGPPELGVLEGDTDPDGGGGITISGIVGCADLTAPFDCVLAGQGTVSLQADGSFSFIPEPGDTDPTASFQYTLIGNPTPGTVTFTRFERVWFVDPNAGGGGNGTSALPFNTLDSLDGAGGAGDSDVAGDYIFVHDGTLALSGPVPMENNQHLIGEGVGLSIPVNLNGNGSPTNLVPAGTKPQVTNATGDAVTMTTQIPIEIVGLSLASTTSNAIDLTSAAALTGSTTLAIGSNEFRAAGAEGIDFNLNAGTTGTLNLNITNNSWNTGGTHTGNAVDINRAAGTLRIDFSNNTNIVSSLTAVNIAGGAAASTTITGFANNTVHQNTGGTGIVVTNATFDATPGGAYQQVSGGTTTIGVSGNGVGGAGMALVPIAGDLIFTDLDIFADGGSGLTVGGTGVVNTGAGTGTRVTVGAGVGIVEATGGAAVDLSNMTTDLQLTSLKSTNSTGAGVLLLNVGDGTTASTFSAGSGSSITNATGTDFSIDGGNATVTYNGTITDDVGQLVLVTNTTADTKSFTGAITDNDDGDGSGISLTNNTGATITFSGGVVLSTGANAAFTATGGGTVAVCDENPCNPGATGANVNKITTTTATALNVANTNIGANNLEFRSISAGTGASGPTNGIVVNNTGAAGGLKVKGTGAAGSGGTIQDTTGHGISLTSTLSPFFDRMNIDDTGGSGIKGADVTNVTITNCVISDSATALGTDESNIAFNTQSAGTENNLDGVVTITGNSLTNAYYHGVDIFNFNGTISDATISNNTITSTTSTATSKGSGIRLVAFGSASTVGNVTKATIDNNIISNFPSGAGIVAQGGNATGAAGTFGVAGNAGNIIAITNNRIAGNSPANRMAINAIQAVVNGTGQGNFNVSGNGTVANPLTNITGNVIVNSAIGDVTVTSTISNNVIVANHTAGVGGALGISIGADSVLPACSGATCDTPDFTITVNGNTISQTDAQGILARSVNNVGSMDIAVTNNTVAAPLSGFREGIQVHSGSSAATGDTSVCMKMTGNTSAGSGGADGIGLRKQGTSSTVHAFAVDGMVATSSPGVETYVHGLNSSADGTTDADALGVTLISATSGFTNCTFVP